MPQLKVSQAYTSANTAGTKNLTLSTPFAIDPSKEYIFGVEFTSVGGYFLGVDAGPLVPGRHVCYQSDYPEDGFWPFDDLGIDNNFFTSVYLSSGNASAPPVVLNSEREALRTSANRSDTERIRFADAQKVKPLPGRLSALKPVRSSAAIAAEDGLSRASAPAVTGYEV